MEDLIERELAASHRFFREWYAGLCPHSEAYVAAYFVGRLDPGFHFIDPTGEIIDVARLGRELWASYGTGSDFAMSAENLRCRFGDGDIVIATYHEWQRNAVRTRPPDNGRIATALFRVDDSAVNGLRWVHVHETWLPEPVVRARFG